MGIVLYLWDWVTVKNGASVQGYVAYTRPTTAVHLGHEMEGASGCTVAQHGVELDLDYGQAVRSRVAWADGYWRAGYCADVLCGVVLHLAMDPCWFGQLREILPGGCLRACLL